MSEREPAVRVTLVPHTHWDREWYEPFSVFSERLVDMMDTLLDLEAHGFPHFHLDGQTAMIDDYLERRPDRADELEHRVAEGGLSAGPWVAQMDEFLASGESHIRNLEMGMARARELGRPLEVGYMPDQFGHVGQMPQILRNGGLDRAMVWRGVPEQIDRSSFRWRSPDGSEVLTGYMVFGYFNGEAFDRAIEPADLAGALERSVAKMRPFMAGDRMVVMVGYDHAGPDATLPERLEATAALTPGIEARVGSIAEHLDDLSLDEDLPVWTGELRSSARAHLLPNVYSARVHQKRERGCLEALLERYAEPLAALAPSFGWPEDELRRAWTLMLWNGAHDSACGCSHDQVARDVDARFAEVRTIGEDIVERALTSLGARTRDGGVIRFNPSPFARDGVPALGYAVVPSAREPRRVDVAVEQIRGGLSIEGTPIRFLDEPDIGDLYTFCFRERGQVPSSPDRVEVRGQDVEMSWDGVRMLARVARFDGEPFVRLEGVIHNERLDHRLRMHVELPEPADRSLAGSPFELVDRPLVGEGGASETPSSTWPARHVVAASRVAMLHEGVVEYEVFGGHELAVTLLRSVGAISKPNLATRPFDAGPHTSTPEAQMLGETAFSVGILPAAPIDDLPALLRGWERFALPIAEAPASGGGDLASVGSLLDLDLGDAQLSNIRRHEGRVEVRVWNPRKHGPAEAVVAGRRVDVGGARIESISLE